MGRKQSEQITKTYKWKKRNPQGNDPMFPLGKKCQNLCGNPFAHRYPKAYAEHPNVLQSHPSVSFCAAISHLTRCDFAAVASSPINLQTSIKSWPLASQLQSDILRRSVLPTTVKDFKQCAECSGNNCNSLFTSNGKKAPPVHAGLSGAPARPTPFRHAPRRQQRAPSRRKRRPAAPGKSTKQNIRPSGPFGLPLKPSVFPLGFLFASFVFPLCFLWASFGVPFGLPRSYTGGPKHQTPRRIAEAAALRPAAQRVAQRRRHEARRWPRAMSGDREAPLGGFWILGFGFCGQVVAKGLEWSRLVHVQAAAEAAKGVGLFWMSGGRARAVVSGRNPASISPRRKTPTCAKCEDPKWTALKRSVPKELQSTKLKIQGGWTIQLHQQVCAARECGKSRALHDIKASVAHPTCLPCQLNGVSIEMVCLRIGDPQRMCFCSLLWLPVKQPQKGYQYPQ